MNTPVILIHLTILAIFSYSAGQEKEKAAASYTYLGYIFFGLITAGCLVFFVTTGQNHNLESARKLVDRLEKENLTKTQQLQKELSK